MQGMCLFCSAQMVVSSCFRRGTPMVSVADERESRSCSIATMVSSHPSGPPPAVLQELLLCGGLPCCSIGGS